MELEKVLAYYRDDTLKYQAACFLIENMPDQYAVLPLDSTDTYARALLSLDKEDPVSWENIPFACGRCIRFYFKNPTRIPD